MNDPLSSVALDDDPEMMAIRSKIHALVDETTNRDINKRKATKPDAHSDYTDLISQIVQNAEEQYSLKQSKQPRDQVLYSDEGNEEWNMIKAALRIENEAKTNKSKYVKDPKQARNDLFSLDFLNERPQTQVQKPEKAKQLSQQQKKIIGTAAQDDDKAEDMMLAFELLNKYKKNPNFIQKELQEQKRKRDLVMPEEEIKQKIGKKPETANFNPLLTQEERHRQIKENKEKRKQEQKLKMIEEEKQKRRAKEKVALKPKTTKQVVDQVMTTNTDADTKIEQLREAKRKIDNETKEQQEEARRIQEEIKKYKQEYLEQEKAQRQYQQQQDSKKKLEEQKKRMEREVERSRKENQKFLLNKLIMTLNSTVAMHTRQSKNSAFASLQSHMMHLKLRELKLTKHTGFNRKQKFFKLWIQLLVRLQNERELERYEQEKARQRQLENQADKLRRHILLKKAYRQMQKHTQQRLQEKQIEEEHEKMKYQIDNFFQNLKQKARVEEDSSKVRLQEREEKQQIKNRLREYQQYKPDYEETSPRYTHLQTNPMHSEISQSQLLEEEFKDHSHFTSADKSENSQQHRLYSPPQRDLTLPDDIQSQQSLNISVQQSISPSDNPSQVSSSIRSRGPRQQNASKTRGTKLQTIQEKPKVLTEMEERAKQRKEKREQLNKQYEEKKQKQEELKRQEEAKKEEEKKKKLAEERESKRKQRLEELKAQEEKKQKLEIEKQSMNNARQYYERQLLIKYGMVPFVALLKEARTKQRLAQNQRRYQLLRNGFDWIVEGVQACKNEEDLRIGKLMKIAERAHTVKVYRKLFHEFRAFQIESKKQSRYLSMRHTLQLQKQALFNWRQALPILREERLQVEQRETVLVYKFRLLKRGKQILRILRENAVEEKIERDKKSYKDQMWNKVNKWLVDLDSKDNNNSNNSDQENKYANY